MTVPAATMVLSSSCCAIGPDITVVVASGPKMVLVTRPTVVEVIVRCYGSFEEVKTI